MNISKIIFAVDDNPKYSGLWEINSEICKKTLGITPVLFHITDEESDFYEDKYGIIKKVKKIQGIDTGRQSQIIRMWATKYFMEEVCIISDIDMLMFNREYFVDQVKQYSDNDLVIYCSDAYDTKRPECVGIYSDRYLLPYNAAKGKTFNLILDTGCEFSDYINRVLSMGFPDFDSDEMYYTYCVDKKNHGVNVIKLERGFYTKFKCPRRIDRIDDSTFNEYEDSLIYNGYYVDCHLSRPFSKYKNEIQELKNKILKNNKEVYLIGCHIENDTQVEFLTSLIESLTKNGKDYILSSHTMIPQRLIENSVGFIYDSINPKYKPWELENSQMYRFESDGFILDSPYIGYGASDYYHVGVIRLIINGLKFIQGTDYKIVHWIEYDSLPDFDMNEKASSELKNYDFVFYGVGSRFSFNIDKVNKSFLGMNDQEIFNQLVQNNYLAEKLIQDQLIFGKKKITYMTESETNTWGRYSQNFNQKKVHWSLFEKNDEIHLFMNNISNENQVIDVVLNHESKKYGLNPYTWYLTKLIDKKDVDFIKILLGNEILLQTLLSNETNYNNIINKVKFIQK